MMYFVEFTTSARDDAREGYIHYNKQREALGAEFMLALEAEVQSILRNPLQYQEQEKNFRRAIMQRFPYGIHYKVIGFQSLLWPYGISSASLGAGRRESRFDTNQITLL
jgi:toxin ParE1/3/4